MSDAHSSPRLSQGERGWRYEWLSVFALLALYWLLAVSAVRGKSATFDETAHLTNGMAVWRTGDFRLQPENGLLPQVWAAAPVAAGDMAFPSLQQEAWWTSNVWEMGHQFFYETGNDPEVVLFRGRLMISVMGVVLGIVVYCWSRKLFGTLGGLVSLSLFALCPNLMAHGTLATSDLTAALFFICSVWAVWGVLHKISAKNVLISALMMGGMFLSKMSAVLLFPIVAVLLVLRLASADPLAVTCGRSWMLSRFWQKTAALSAVACFHLVLIAAMLWASYGFRYSMMKDGQAGRDALKAGGWEAVLKDSGAMGNAIKWARDHQALPEAYLYGFAIVMKHEERRSFLNGEHSLRGWWHFFPYAAGVKTPLSFFVLLFLATLALGAGWRDASNTGSRWRTLQSDLYRMAPLLTLFLVYGLAALQSKLNIGLRHLLPLYPVLYIMGGAAAYWVERKMRLPSILVALCLLFSFVEAARTWPNYLAYFNPLAGGPRGGYKHLVDSSLDWGQDLLPLKRWLEHQRLPQGAEVEPVYLSYFGTADPVAHGLKINLLPCFPDTWRERRIEALQGGIYCISASILQGVYTKPWGKWTQLYETLYQKRLAEVTRFRQTQSDPPARAQLLSEKGQTYWMGIFSDYENLRLARLCAYLRQREPDDQVGFSILIYRLTDQMLADALQGPPAERATAPHKTLN